jgi:hypothetical protein
VEHIHTSTFVQNDRGEGLLTFYQDVQKGKLAELHNMFEYPNLNSAYNILVRKILKAGVSDEKKSDYIVIMAAHSLYHSELLNLLKINIHQFPANLQSKMLVVIVDAAEEDFILDGRLYRELMLFRLGNFFPSFKVYLQSTVRSDKNKNYVHVALRD